MSGQVQRLMKFKQDLQGHISFLVTHKNKREEQSEMVALFLLLIVYMQF